MKSFSFGRRLAAVAAAASLVLLGAGRHGRRRTGRRAGPAPREPIRIMPLGDSITYGVGSSALDSYRGALFWRLAQAGVAVDYVGSMRSGRLPRPGQRGPQGLDDRAAGRARSTTGWPPTGRT